MSHVCARKKMTKTLPMKCTAHKCASAHSRGCMNSIGNFSDSDANNGMRAIAFHMRAVKTLVITMRWSQTWSLHIKEQL